MRQRKLKMQLLRLAVIIAILGAPGVLGYVIATPTAGEKSTEFYIVGTEGKAADYPRELVVGEEVKCESRQR